jgi:type VI secretion system protein VasD
MKKNIAYGLMLILLTACQPKMRLIVESAHYLNPDINGHAAPILVTVFQLKNSYTFSQANYDALLSNSSSILGDDLIDKTSFEVRPGTHLKITENLYNNTHYIGIVAAYRNPNISSWHKMLSLKNPAQSVDIDLDLEAQGLSAEIS